MPLAFGIKIRDVLPLPGAATTQMWSAVEFRTWSKKSGIGNGYNSPEKALERMEGMRASSSLDVSSWSFLKQRNVER